MVLFYSKYLQIVFEMTEVSSMYWKNFIYWEK